jgi:hypothetical protein
MSTQHEQAARPRDRKEPSLWLRLGAVALPILKCAVCPACLSIFGSVFAGARLGFLYDEGWHATVILVALAADVAILGASMRHHSRRGPLWLCAGGAVLAVGGHFFVEVVEYLGFAVLLAAGIWNAVLLRRHRHEADSCCAHDRGATRLAEHAGAR